MLDMNFFRPPGRVDATTNHTISAKTVPMMAPVDMARPVSRDQNIDNAMGITAEPTSIPMNR